MAGVFDYIRSAASYGCTKTAIQVRCDVAFEAEDLLPSLGYTDVEIEPRGNLLKVTGDDTYFIFVSWDKAME